MSDVETEDAVIDRVRLGLLIHRRS
jgi:hypothetical protein